jgi:hydroxyacid-oxoacid transhydrogenase
VRKYVHPGYEASGHALVPHGVSVILNAPAVFRWTESACPDRHAAVARLFGGSGSLADELTGFMQRLRMPNGLGALGYTTSDVPALVAGAMQQQRITSLSPRPVDEEAFAKLFEDAMRAW